MLHLSRHNLALVHESVPELSGVLGIKQDKEQVEHSLGACSCHDLGNG
jgi:hypothetical protein